MRKGFGAGLALTGSKRDVGVFDWLEMDVAVGALSGRTSCRGRCACTRRRSPPPRCPACPHPDTLWATTKQEREGHEVRGKAWGWTGDTGFEGSNSRYL